MKKLYGTFLFIAFCILSYTASAQIITTSNGSGNQLAQKMAGDGVTITNVQFNCPTGAAGMFNCVNCNLGMDSGIVLTTGSVALVQGPNTDSAATVLNGTAGDQDLTDIINEGNPWWQPDDPTFDACVLEFDMKVLSDSVEFKYIFGSDEYPEYTCSEFNDVFAFLISGPGIVGERNIALIPGTTTPVAINAVNGGVSGIYGDATNCTSLAYSSMYVNNGFGGYPPQSQSDYYIQYDGFTTTLTAKQKNLQPCQTYHLKLAIADAFDGIYDSGVFIEANSLTSNGVKVEEPTTDDPNVRDAVEFCVSGRVRFTVKEPSPVASTIKFKIGGTAENGVDYLQLIDSVILPANDTQVSISIVPLGDAFADDSETVVIYLFNACDTLNPYDSSVLYILDTVQVDAGADTTVCAGTPLQLNASEGIVYAWTPAAGLSDTTIYNPVLVPPPTASKVYYVSTRIGVCVSTDSVVITVIPPPFTVDAGPDQALCTGQTAQLNAVITGTPLPGSPFTQAWTPAAELNDTTILNPVATPLTPTSTYVVSVRSAECVQTDTVIVTSGSLGISGALTDETCFGAANGTASVTVNTGTPPYQYAWSTATAGNVSVVNNLTAGTYYVTVTDSVSCGAIDTFVITSPPAIYFTTPTLTNASCFTTSDGSITITATGGAGGFSYSWSNMDIGSTITNLPPTTYTVTATDVNNCSADTSVVVGSQPQIIIGLVPTDISCFGADDGSIAATVSGGVGGFSYLWSNSQPVEDITGLAQGNYVLTVTDANGCTQTANATINEPALLVTGTPTVVDVLCYGGNNGSVTINPAGGTPQYTIVWSVPGNGTSITGLVANTYTTTVTDANGCTATGSYTVTQPLAPLEITNAVVTDATCFGTSDGSVVITVAGGTTAYTYTWSNGVTTAANSNIPAGTYAVTVTDANGCSVTALYTVNQPTEIIFSQVSYTNVSCFNGTNGTATVTATGGGGTYTYVWNTSGYVDNTLTAVGDGTYSVTATDAAGCTADTLLVITEPTLLSTTADAANVSCNTGTDGTATASPVGGTPPYSYGWSNSRTTQTIIGLGASQYFITVTDANMCTATAGTIVTEPTSISATYTAEAPKCVNTIDGTLTASAQGGTPPYVYTLQLISSNIASNTTGEFIGLAANTYNVLVTDSNNCPFNISTIVPLPSDDVFSYATDTTSCYGSEYNDGIITVIPISFINAPYSYTIDGGAPQLSEIFYNQSAGEHTLSITSANGCVTDTVLFVPQPIEGFVEVLPTDTTVTAGETIQLSSTFSNYPASAISSYIWSPGAGLSCMDCANPMFNGYATTTFTLTVVYHNGCVATTTTDIYVDGNPPIFVPNAFTPNGDGNNDVFMLYSQQVAKVRLKVFNRWGEKVFDSTNQFEGWDGFYQGVLQPSGVFTYIAEVTYLDGETATQNGSVTLIR